MQRLERLFFKLHYERVFHFHMVVVMAPVVLAKAKSYRER
jgi:hypothetical protein